MRLLFLLIFIAVPAHAELYTNSKIGPTCSALQAYTTPDGVETNSIKGMGLDVVRVPIDYDIGQLLQQALPEGVELKPEIGYLEIHQDGRIFYGDTEITSVSQSGCRMSIPIDEDWEQKSSVSYTRTRQNPPEAVPSAPVQQEPLEAEETSQPTSIDGQYNE